jgi:hypothetical protein
MATKFTYKMRSGRTGRDMDLGPHRVKNIIII